MRENNYVFLYVVHTVQQTDGKKWILMFYVCNFPTNSELAVAGRHIDPISLSDSPGTHIYNTVCTNMDVYTQFLNLVFVLSRHICIICELRFFLEEDALKEEILAQHGVLEEYIAFDNRYVCM